VIRELNELSLWFEEIYDSDPQGLHEVWRGLVAAMESASTGSVTLDVMDSYKVLLPGSLKCRSLNKPITFCSSSSRPVTCLGLPKDRCDELLSLLLNTIFNNFRACSRPEDYLERADEIEKISETHEQKVVLVGASNLNRARQYFETAELAVVNHSTPGWTPTLENVKTMTGVVENEAKRDSAFVFDIFGNSAIRFEQFDGTTALPFKINGRYHLGGKIVPTPIATFRKVVEQVLPIFKAKGQNAAIIVPPLARYVFSRCCNDVSHCTNAAEMDFPEKLLSGLIQQRSELIKGLVQSGVKNFKVLDVGCVTDGATTANISEKLGDLKKVTAGDGVHFTPLGYQNLVRRTVNCLKTLTENKPTTARKSTFFWRGFRSLHGSISTNNSRLAMAGRGGHFFPRASKMVGLRGTPGGRRSRSQLFHPYRRW
jgi:hypothetical protein